VNAVLDNWRTAPVEPKLRAMLGFLEKLTLQPDTLSADDIRTLRAAGLSDVAIEDAIHSCVLFNIYDRLADAFEFDIPDRAAFARSAASLLSRGYA
jgi:uncharacterized peroxidase-related enzyme